MIGIYDSDDILITKAIQSAFTKTDLKEIKNKTLDGQWHIQTVGTAGITLSVTAKLKLEEKDILDAHKKISAPLKVIFDGKWYTGIIDDEIDYSRESYSEHPMFPTEFTLLVNDEGVV